MPSHSLDVLARLPLAVPSSVVRHIEAAGQDRPVVALPAASVILVRDGVDGVESYLLHRHGRMAFAPNKVVFPGGRVDFADGHGSEAVRTCALRETLEETGVALVDGDLLPWAHWTTPEAEPRRYDTHFFLAVLPSGQVARDISGETDAAEWTGPAAALTAADEGAISLMPPTRSILLELADVQSVADLVDLAADRVVVEVLPKLIKVGEAWQFSYPTQDAI